MDFEPPEDTPAPESLQTLRTYHDCVRLLLGYDIIVNRNLVDVTRTTDLIRTQGWNGEIEIESNEPTVWLLAGAEYEIIGVHFYIVQPPQQQAVEPPQQQGVEPPQQQGGEPQQ